jgi:putative transposase
MEELRLTPARRRQLRSEMESCREARCYRRLLAILEVDQGRPVADVARSLGVSRQSIHNWLRAYRDQPTVETLHDQPRPGRPTRWNDALREDLREWLDRSPREYGYAANVWTVPLMQEFLRLRHKQFLGENTLRRELHNLGYTWKRSRYVLTPDPEFEKKTPDPSPFAEFAAAERNSGRG